MIGVDRDADAIAERVAQIERFREQRNAAAVSGLIGWRGSMASGTFDARACGKIAAMPSANIWRAALMSREPFGSPPPIMTMQSAPIAAASSIMRLLSSTAA